ncbi:Glutathione S-transferase theta-4 [Chionoecetes opilio]|uniref:Glutathione S-transferase theta-4 n=1 Tax=Chionoecetes opilio TaxID=41210 RepID=A0A8J4YQY1_CHIOP|nr:Glutathione S-transferase theta-4 [Chionoecetes opilio]
MPTYVLNNAGFHFRCWGDHLKKPFEDVNPFKKVPAVQDGDFRILESCAALRYIASKYDSAGTWYPADLKVRCKVDEYLDWQHLNTRTHGLGYFVNMTLVPMKTGTEPDMTVVQKHEEELGRVEDLFASYFLNDKPFIAGDTVTIADLQAACEFEQPQAAGYKLKTATKEYLERVRKAVGHGLYDELHAAPKDLVKAMKK